MFIIHTFKWIIPFKKESHWSSFCFYCCDSEILFWFLFLSSFFFCYVLFGFALNLPAFCLQQCKQMTLEMPGNENLSR